MSSSRESIACTLYGDATRCPGGGTPTMGVCVRCASYVASDSPWEVVRLTVNTIQPSTKRRQLPVPRSEWPLAARIVAKFATPEDRGIGSTLTRLIKHVGGEWFEKTFETLVGKSCGCRDRSKHLDDRFPY